jgi:uncharacterized protein (TIRG00374 family)
MNKARLLILLLWLMALALVSWALGQLPFTDIANSIRALDPLQWIFWLGLNLLVLTLSSLRWQGLTSMLGESAGFTKLFAIKLAGQTISFITPGPQFGGEPLQIYWLYQHCGIAIHRAILSLTLDRFYELWVNFSVLLAGLIILLYSQLEGAADWAYLILVLTTLVLALPLLGIAILKRPRWFGGFMARLAQRWQHHPRLQQLDSHWQKLTAELSRVLRYQRPALLRGLLLSVIGWVCILGELYLLLSFLNIDPSVADFVLLFVAVRLAMLLPLPGGIGTIEAALLWSFQILEFSASAAIGLIALMRLRDAIILLAGLLCLRGMHKA